jgi:YbbR domain-containing protein
MSDLANLNRENVSVTVDLSEIEEPGDYELSYEVRLPATASGQSVNWSPRTSHVKVTADRHDTKAVEVVLVGETVQSEEHYVVKKEILTPAVVLVSGPEKELDKISYAGVELTKTQPISSTHRVVLPFKLYDAEDKPIINEHLTTDVSEIVAEFPVILEKEVPVSLEFRDGGGLTKDNINYTIDPGVIQVAGDPDKMSGYNSYELGVIDLADVLESGPKVIIGPPLPNEIEMVVTVESFTVHIEIHGVETITRQVPTVAINYSPPPGYRLVTHTTSISVTLRGSPEALAAVTSTNLQAVIDLTDTTLSPNERISRPVTVEAPDTVGVIGEYHAFLELVPIEEDDEG